MIFFTGLLVGIVSLIPGISGGTILILMKKYELITNSIANFKNIESKIILLKLIMGVILGALFFARIIEFCFYLNASLTFVFFSSLIILSIPDFIKAEKIKPNIIFVILGFLLIIYLSTFKITNEVIITSMPKINIIFLITFLLFGVIDGFFTILPGISGSMIMMILGPYFLYKTYLANLSFTNIVYLIPLTFYILGDTLGFFIGSKVSIYLLNKYKKIFLSFILGMVIASSIILIPLVNLTFKKVILYLIILLISKIILDVINLFN